MGTRLPSRGDSRRHDRGIQARPKLVFAAPLELGMLAEHELADLYLAERLPAPDLRARLTAGSTTTTHL